MKINIVTSLNSSYKKFGKIFLNSLHKNLNLNNIENIFVLDVGLSEDDKSWLSNYSKVTVVDMSINTEFSGIWGDGWEKSVSAKTLGFKKLLSDGNYPLVMIDSDCLFLKDFDDVLDDSYDLQICKRNYGTPYLASFFVAHNEKAIDFVEDWISNINELKVMPKETTAMNNTIESYRDKLLIGDVDENLISSLSYHENARIIHMKSTALDDSFDTTFVRRTNGVKNLSSNFILEYLKDFKNKLLIYGSGGMGNRLSSIINGLYFNDVYFNGDVILYWPNEIQCDCEFTDLFELPSDMSVINTLDELDDNFTIFGEYSPTRPSVAPVVGSFESLLVDDMNYPQNVATITDTIIGNISTEYISDTLKKFIPTKHIKNEVNKFCDDNNINKNTLGLHIRRTDGRHLSVGDDEYFIDNIKNFEDDNIFICSDSYETENKLKSLFPDKVVFRKKLSYTEKIYDDDWNDIEVFDEKQNKNVSIRYNVKISKQAVIDGLIDIIILSKTNFTSGVSTFSQMAFYLGYN